MPDTPRPDAPRRLAKKVLLIGWDAADWKVITPLLDAGKMPALESLIDRGVMGNLATLDPPLSPMLWTSIATGKTADQHGILGFVQPTSDGTRLRPVLGTSRKCKAVWNILNQSGLRSNVVGWWPSHPAEPLNGAMVSNFYHRASNPIFEPWPLTPGSVYPPELADTLAELRVHPQELTPAHLSLFAQPLVATDRKQINGLAKTIADASSVQAAATYLLEHTEWDFTAVYFDAIDHFGHGFMKYHPPQRPNIPDEMFERYSGVVEAGYRFHDMLLSRLLDFADDDTAVVLISDHGFHSDHLRPLGLPDDPAAPALEHRDFGIIVMAGPGIKKDDRIYGASLLNVAPTVLSLFGLPIGRDMAAQPLAQAFADIPEIPYIDSWESVDGDSGQHTADAKEDPWSEQEALRQLVELGYVDAPSEDVAGQIRDAERESQFYLARVYLSTRRPNKALPILESLYAEVPEERFFGRLLACYINTNRKKEARALFESYKAHRALKFAAQDHEAGSEEAPTPSKHGQARLAFMEGNLFMLEGRAEEAVGAFRIAEEATPHRPMLHRRLGDAYIMLQRWTDAERALLKALTIDPDNELAHRSLSLAYLHQHRYQEAADAALRAVGLRFHFPAAHYHLGEALTRLGRYNLAAQSFEVALSQAPNMTKANRWLAELYRTHLDQPAKAAHHLRIVDTRKA
ncbi:MAG: alkaline phosphatase family protein [Bacteroidota bacterium]